MSFPSSFVHVYGMGWRNQYVSHIYNEPLTNAWYRFCNNVEAGGRSCDSAALLGGQRVASAATSACPAYRLHSPSAADQLLDACVAHPPTPPNLTCTHTPFVLFQSHLSPCFLVYGPLLLDFPMSFLGGAECSTGANPLSQFTKHVQDDKSLQRDRLVGRGPGGMQEGMRSQQMGGPSDGVSQRQCMPSMSSRPASHG